MTDPKDIKNAAAILLQRVYVEEYRFNKFYVRVYDDKNEKIGTYVFVRADRAKEFAAKIQLDHINKDWN